MRLAILGYGVEGKSVEKFFQTHPYENIPPEEIEIEVFDDFKDEEIDSLGLEKFDVVFRSPSVRPHYDYKKYDSEQSYLHDKPYWTSATKYFFQHCPCEIIAVSGTKGKGTTCSMITAILEAINSQLYRNNPEAPKTFLVGNIGKPALEVLDQLHPIDNVVYEISSFQLWDLHASSYIGVLLRIEPDHLNVHYDLDDYYYAKSNLSTHKKADEHLVYFTENPTTKTIAEKSKAIKHPYPIDLDELSELGRKRFTEIMDNIKIPGAHNRENASAALLAVSARFNYGGLDGFLCSELFPATKSALENFESLPHRLQFVRELNNVKYYDDNYSSALPAMDVALKTFENYPTVLISGGFSRGLDDKIKKRIFSAKNLAKVILIGDTAKAVSEGEDPEKFEIADSLEDAVSRAKKAAEQVATAEEPAIVVMSPGFPSFDMFKNFTERGELFTKFVKNLK